MRKLLLLASATALLSGSPASASLTLFQSWTGNYGLSSDGAGSLSAGNVISANVPAGATVVAAYLYQSNYDGGGNQPVSLNGTALTFSPNVLNATACCGLNSARADVTSIVAGIVNGGSGGNYDFAVNEGNTGQTDGTALVVVYQLPGLGTSTISILDGYSAPGGDTATLNFLTPLNPTAPGFQAEMRLGIGFSCGDPDFCGSQSSNVTVNGTTITTNAGNHDDGNPCCNGALITVGGDNDPFSALLPSYVDDHERYNLVPYIQSGDTAINIRTNNPSNDDNIFLALFAVTGEASVVTSGVPEPSTWAMMLLGFGAIGFALRRRSRLKPFQLA